MSPIALPDIVRENLQFMRLAITLLALSIVTGAGLYFGSMSFLGYTAQRAAASAQRLETAQQQYAKAVTETEEIRDYLPTYRSLAATGRAGEEQRLEWIDALTRIREQHKLFPINYDIASRRPYNLPAGPSTDALTLSASRMELRFGLLHEGDLLTLLNGLRTEAKGFYVLDRCSLTRNNTADPTPQQAENLQGECTLDWLSFQPVDSGEAKP